MVAGDWSWLKGHSIFPVRKEKDQRDTEEKKHQGEEPDSLLQTVTLDQITYPVLKESLLCLSSHI